MSAAAASNFSLPSASSFPLSKTSYQRKGYRLICQSVRKSEAKCVFLPFHYDTMATLLVHYFIGQTQLSQCKFITLLCFQVDMPSLSQGWFTHTNGFIFFATCSCFGISANIFSCLIVICINVFFPYGSIHVRDKAFLLEEWCLCKGWILHKATWQLYHFQVSGLYRLRAVFSKQAQLCSKRKDQWTKSVKLKLK